MECGNQKYTNIRTTNKRTNAKGKQIDQRIRTNMYETNTGPKWKDERDKPTGNQIREQKDQPAITPWLQKLALKRSLTQAQEGWGIHHKHRLSMKKAETLLQETWHKHTTMIVKEGQGGIIEKNNYSREHRRGSPEYITQK